jgi:ligand-binding sensor domain-containing protein/ABC-type multidrug transport system fused ATPase/permease subunit
MRNIVFNTHNQFNMTRSKLFLWICLFFMLPLNNAVRSQSVNTTFDRITIKEGLSQSTVNRIIQDKHGFMWFATYGGINRFDGYTFANYVHDENDNTSLGNNSAEYLFEDREGYIWIVNNGNTGLNRFNPETGKFDHFLNDPKDSTSISSNTVTHVMQDKSGNIWICTSSALDLVVKNKKGGLPGFRHFMNPPGSKAFAKCFEDSKGNLLLFSNTLNYFDRQKKTFTLTDIVVTTSDVISIVEDKAGNIYLPTNTSGITLLVYDKSSSKYQLGDNSKINVAPMNRNCLVIDDLGFIWIGTENQGLFRYDPMTYQMINFTPDKLDSRSISDVNIYSLFVDRSGVLWIGTYSQGLCKYDLYRKNFKLYKSIPGKGNSMSGNVISGISSNSSSELWVGSRDEGGINRFIFNGNEEPTVLHYMHNPNDNNTIASNSSLCLIQRKNGEVWIGSQGNMSRMVPEEPGSGKRPVVKRYNMQGWTFEMFEDSKGTLWGGTWGGGLWRYNEASDDFTYFSNDPKNPSSVCDNIIWALGEDNKGNLWVGGHSEGLSILPAAEKEKANPKFIHYSHIKGDAQTLSNNTINVFYLDKKGTMWIGTNEGLCKLLDTEKSLKKLTQKNSLRFASYYKKDGLPSDAIVGLAEGDDGFLWMSTSMGISKFDRTNISFVNFDEGDGLQSNEFWHYAYYMNPEGTIFFGGANGFNAFNPKDIKPNPFLPVVVFTDLKMFNKSVKVGEKINNHIILTKPIYETPKIILSHKNNAFTIEFAALHYTQPSKNKYSYMLDGFDKKWNNVGNQRSATYTNLSAGKYVFRVKGTNSDGVWSKNEATIIIRVRPPWWKTWWFIILMVGSISYMVYKYFGNRVAAEKRDKEILQAKIEKGENELKKQKDEIEQHKKEIQEKEQAAMETNWFNKGMTTIMDIISKNSRDLDTMASQFINVLVDYLGVDVGAFYILNKPENETPYFELVGSFALSDIRSKNSVPVDEGYLGACYKEKKKLIVDNLPKGYILLESGLGQVSLNNLILIPLLLDNDLKGIIELAATEMLPDYKVSLLDKLADNLASSIEIVQMNSRMKKMVDQLHEHMEEMNSQKEEMMQNIEEMKATQEESERIKLMQDEMESRLSKQHETINNMEEELEALRKEYSELQEKYKRAVGE